jgi:NAD(P)-dependent dehydrogenase (short-subunit alcohol dehydrogenase family)
VNISSANAVPPRRPFTNRMRAGGSTAYAAAKAALNRLTQGLAEELVKYNIAVNVVAPSTAILSPGAAELTPEGWNENSRALGQEGAALMRWRARPCTTSDAVSVSRALISKM